MCQLELCKVTKIDVPKISATKGDTEVAGVQKAIECNPNGEIKAATTTINTKMDSTTITNTKSQTFEFSSEVSFKAYVKVSATAPGVEATAGAEFTHTHKFTASQTNTLSESYQTTDIKTVGSSYE